MRNAKMLTDVEVLRNLKRGAMQYSVYVDKDLLFLYRHSKEAPYECYEVHFGKENFMHLAGIKSKTLSAIDFYEACLDGSIKREDCTPRHSVVNMHSKIGILAELLDLKRCRLYKIGEKDLVTRDNDFEMATGNNIGTLGYDSRVTKRGSNEIDRTKLPIPTTLLNNPITDYCSTPEKIMFVLQKDPSEEKYNNILFEIKKELFLQEKEGLEEYIKEKLVLD